MKNTGNPNRPRSKNNPNGKRNDPLIDWPKYNKGRKSEGDYYIAWMPKVANKAREILGIPEGEYDWQISAILVSIVKSGLFNLQLILQITRKCQKTNPKLQCLVRTSKVAIGKSRSVATSLFV